MPEWKFEKKQRRQKTRNPMQASFFTNASIDDDTHALVREAIQNSLDAKIQSSQEPVRVRFSLGNIAAGSDSLTRHLSSEAWKHFSANDNGLTNPPTASDDCRYLVFEDFNTSGLIGNEQAHDAEPDNAFYYFLRAEGQTGKDEGDRGRHGIGKYVFPYTSGIKMFIMATVRASDCRCLVAGQSILNSHTVDGVAYTPDGWWGEFDVDGFQLPVEDKDILNVLAKDFGLSRTIADSGLSIVMPYVASDIGADLIAQHVIAEYFMPILQGQLVAEVLEEGSTRIIDSDSLKTSLPTLLPQDKLNEIAPFVELAIASLDRNAITEITLPVPEQPCQPVWNKSLIDKENALSISNALEKNESVLCLKVPVSVKRKKQDSEWSILNLYLRKESGETRSKPLFVREGITIPEDRVSKVRGYTCLAFIEAGPLATLLGDSENPAHTEWEKNAVKFKGKYQWGPTTIDFVRLSFSKLLRLLSQADEEEDRDVLADIFFIDMEDEDDDVPSEVKRRRKKKKGKITPVGLVPKIQRRAPQYQLSKISGGFSLTGSSDAPAVKRKFRVRVAYDIDNSSKAKALREYHPNDFVLSEKNTKFENVTNAEYDGQSIKFLARDNSFRLEATGFDIRRDIIVDVVPEAIVDETL